MEWRPIETRPDNETPCWITDAATNTMVVAYPAKRMPKGIWYLMWANRMLNWTPTHWMPLPAPLSQVSSLGKNER